MFVKFVISYFVSNFQPLQVHYYILVSIFLLCIGIYLLLTRTNPVMALMGVELIFNAANINMIAFSKVDASKQGWFFSLFLFVIVACESVVALLIFYMLNRQSGNSELDKADLLKD
ncbi:MAG: NADH-quinone oxidoreductase subunit NuoK [Opitutaceae bacterium]|nr:NADH-quinone oxidoreductase subunit NuoK [Cytophagales bacterium]